jgi:hypothetical protein
MTTGSSAPAPFVEGISVVVLVPLQRGVQVMPLVSSTKLVAVASMAGAVAARQFVRRVSESARLLAEWQALSEDRQRKAQVVLFT